MSIYVTKTYVDDYDVSIKNVGFNAKMCALCPSDYRFNLKLSLKRKECEVIPVTKTYVDDYDVSIKNVGFNAKMCALCPSDYRFNLKLSLKRKECEVIPVIQKTQCLLF